MASDKSNARGILSYGRVSLFFVQGLMGVRKKYCEYF